MGLLFFWSLMHLVYITSQLINVWGILAGRENWDNLKSLKWHSTGLQESFLVDQLLLLQNLSQSFSGLVSYSAWNKQFCYQFRSQITHFPLWGNDTCLGRVKTSPRAPSWVIRTFLQLYHLPVRSRFLFIFLFTLFSFEHTLFQCPSSQQCFIGSFWFLLAFLFLPAFWSLSVAATKFVACFIILASLAL